MARFFDDDTSSGTNINIWDYEHSEDNYTINNTKAKKSYPTEKTPTKREQNRDNLRRIQEETRKRGQKKLR